jgi:hypothetical protein
MNRGFMRIISFLLRKRNRNEPNIEAPVEETPMITQSYNHETIPTTTDSMQHLSYPFYLLSRTPR